MIFLVEVEATAVGEVEVEADNEAAALFYAAERGLERSEVDELRDTVAQRARVINDN